MKWIVLSWPELHHRFQSVDNDVDVTLRYHGSEASWDASTCQMEMPLTILDFVFLQSIFFKTLRAGSVYKRVAT